MQAILVFAGSARTNAFSKKLAKSATLIIRRRTPIRARATLIDLANFDAQLFDADLECLRVPESMQAIKAMVRNHDGLLIATSGYNGFIPPLLVNLFSVDLALRGVDILAARIALGNGGDRCVSEILGIMNARRLATDVLLQFICSLCAANGFLIQLHAIKVTMNQKSSTLNSKICPKRPDARQPFLDPSHTLLSDRFKSF